MAKRIRYTPEQIITKLREAEVYLSQGKTVGQACKILEISEQTYYRWRREYGGMDVTQARKLKEMEKENTQLKMPLADQTPIVIPVLVEVPHPDGPQGAKGFAESPSLPTAPAILNALYATVGIRIRDLPADKKIILDALKQKDIQD